MADVDDLAGWPDRTKAPPCPKQQVWLDPVHCVPVTHEPRVNRGS
jgi:hypothetical protein